MTNRERLIKVLAGRVPDCVPASPDFSNMIPARRTGKPFWQLYLYNDPPIWEAYIDCANLREILIARSTGKGTCSMQQRDRLQLEWKLGFSGGLSERPREWVPATVPGAVQADYAAQAGIAELFRAESLPRIQWAEDRYWWYAATIGPARPADHDRRRIFVAKGVDYQFQIRFNGRMLHDQEGMFAPAELDLTDLAREGGELLVVIRPIPKAPAPADRLKVQASRGVKPAVGYGWDFHPRLVPLGIWDDAYIELRPASRLCDAELRYQLSDDCGEARLTLEACVAAGMSGQRLQWSLRDPGGREVLSRSCAMADPTVRDSAALAGPELWWPNGQGSQSLYTFTATLIGPDGHPLDQLSCRVGFRRVRLVINAGAWDEPRTFPKSRSHPPMTLEINGRRIFAKGSNWVPPDMLYGRLNREVYAKHLRLARDAHFNILRV
jgi:beta-mannosidase